MTTNETARSRRISLISAAASWAAAMLIAASISGLWFLLAEHSLWDFILLTAPLALMAVVIFRQHSHSLAGRRFQAAWDAYAQMEQAKEEDRLQEGLSRSSSGARSVNESWCRNSSW